MRDDGRQGRIRAENAQSSTHGNQTTVDQREDLLLAPCGPIHVQPERATDSI